MRLAIRILSAVFLLAAAACSRQSAPSAPPPQPAVALAAEQASQTGSASVGEAYVTAATILRREPTEASKVPGARPKQVISNHLATLQRGEKVTLLDSKGDWARVRASDESTGWMKPGFLLPATGVTEATLLEPADAFDRPDLLAVNARRKIEPGTLVLVIRGRELFSEVNISSGVSAWVLTDRLSTAPRAVSAAKLVDKARWLARLSKPDEAKTVLELARKEFSDVPLVEVLARELGEAPDGGEADGGPAPAGSPSGSPGTAGPDAARAQPQPAP